MKVNYYLIIHKIKKGKGSIPNENKIVNIKNGKEPFFLKALLN